MFTLKLSHLHKYMTHTHILSRLCFHCRYEKLPGTRASVWVMTVILTICVCEKETRAWERLEECSVEKWGRDKQTEHWGTLRKRVGGNIRVRKYYTSQSLFRWVERVGYHRKERMIYRRGRAGIPQHNLIMILWVIKDQEGFMSRVN